MGDWGDGEMPGWALPLPLLPVISSTAGYGSGCCNGSGGGDGSIAPAAPLFVPPGGPPARSSTADWAARGVLCKGGKPGPPANRPAVLSSGVSSVPEQQVGSCALPCDIHSQQLFGGNLGGSFMSKGGSVFRQLGRPLFHQLVMNTGPLMLGAVSGDIGNFAKMSPQEILDAKALAASKSHSEAERRRRERINTHLTTLRSLLPSSTKTDKASLLAEVIEHVKHLKRQAAEIAELGGGPVPTDVDELRVDPDPSSPCTEGSPVIRASLCCDDRPDLLSDLIRALRTLRLKTVRAEIATLGGRVKNVFVMTAGDGKGQREDSPSVNRVQEALRAVMERPGCSDLPPASSKRQRLISTPQPSSSREAPDQRCLGGGWAQQP